MSQLNKIPLEHSKNHRTDETLKYVIMLHEKDEQLSVLTKVNECLKQQLAVSEKLAEEYKAQSLDVRKLKKMEQTNMKLKAMLKESQDYILDHQKDLSDYQEIQQTILGLTQYFKFTEKTTLMQRLKFLQEHVFNENLVQEFFQIEQLFQEILSSVKLPQQLQIKEELVTKYLSHQKYHPFSTSAVVERFLLLINEVLPKSKKQTNNLKNHAKQYQEQIKQISLFQTSVDIVTYEEEQLLVENKQLRGQIKSIQDELMTSQNEQQTLATQISQLNKKVLELQKQLKTLESAKPVERQPFIAPLSIREVESEVSSESCHHEEHIEQLERTLRQKEDFIKSQEILIQQIQRQKDGPPKSGYDLILYCKNLKELVKSYWQFNFVSENGLSEHDFFYSFIGIDSRKILQTLRELSAEAFSIPLLQNSAPINSFNQDLIYLKNYFAEQNYLISLKQSVPPTFSGFVEVEKDYEAVQGFEEFWIALSLSKGVLFICVDKWNSQNLNLISLSCFIQKVLGLSGAIVVIYEQPAPEVLQQLEFEEFSSSKQKAGNKILMSLKEFSLKNIRRLSSKNQDSFIPMFREFLEENLSNFFEITNDYKFELFEVNDQVYNLQLISDGIKVLIDRKTTYIIKEYQDNSVAMQNKSVQIKIELDSQCASIKSYYQIIQNLNSLIKVTIYLQNGTKQRYNVRLPLVLKDQIEQQNNYHEIILQAYF